MVCPDLFSCFCRCCFLLKRATCMYRNTQNKGDDWRLINKWSKTCNICGLKLWGLAFSCSSWFHTLLCFFIGNSFCRELVSTWKLFKSSAVHRLKLSWWVGIVLIEWSSQMQPHVLFTTSALTSRSQGGAPEGSSSPSPEALHNKFRNPAHFLSLQIGLQTESVQQFEL